MQKLPADNVSAGSFQPVEKASQSLRPQAQIK